MALKRVFAGFYTRYDGKPIFVVRVLKDIDTGESIVVCKDASFSKEDNEHYYLIRYASFCEQVEVDGVLRDKYVRQTRREIDEGTVREVYEDGFLEPKSKPFTYVDDEYAERAIRCIIFNGNGYEEAWIKEAEKRGLANLHNTAEALPTYILPKNIELLTRQGVYSKEEIFSRHEVHIEKYCKVIRIEAATLVDMVQHGILNAASEYEAALCSTIAAKRAAAPELTCHVESSLANAIGSLNEQLLEETIGLKTALETVSDDAEPETLLHYYHDEVEKRTNDVRKTVDKLEVLTASKYWPYPTFCELLFSV